jgi:hypothetical protein
MGAAIVGMILPSAFTIPHRLDRELRFPRRGLDGGHSDQERLRRTTLPDTSERCSERRRSAQVSDPKGRSRRSSREQDLAARQRQLEDECSQPQSNRLSPVRTHPRRLPVLRTLAAQPPGPSSRVALTQASSPQVPQAQTVRAKVQQLNSFAFARQLPWLTIGSPLALFLA